MSDDFDITAYVHAPRLDVAGDFALATALLTSAPSDLRTSEKKALTSLRNVTVELQTAWRAQADVQKAPDPRPADRAVDNAWAALVGRLESYALLPLDRHPRAKRAAELLERLFPDRLAFTQLEYAAEWAESDKRLGTIDKGLATDIDALCGKEFLYEVRGAHEAYGKMLGITAGAMPRTIAPSVAEPLRALSRAVQQYATQIAASVDLDDPNTVARARAALTPIDRVRANAARSSKGDATVPTATPADPVPPVKD